MTLFNNKIYRYPMGIFFIFCMSLSFISLATNVSYAKVKNKKLQSAYGYSKDYEPQSHKGKETKEVGIERATDDKDKKFVDNPTAILNNKLHVHHGQVVRVGYVLERMGYPFLGLSSNHITGYEPALIKRVCKLYSWSCYFIPLHDFNVKVAFETSQVDILIGRLEDGYKPIKGMLKTKTLLAFNYILLTNDSLANITSELVSNTKVLYVETGDETRKHISEKLLELTLEAKMYEFRTVKALYKQVALNAKLPPEKRQRYIVILDRAQALWWLKRQGHHLGFSAKAKLTEHRTTYSWVISPNFVYYKDMINNAIKNIYSGKGAAHLLRIYFDRHILEEPKY